MASKNSSLVKTLREEAEHHGAVERNGGTDPLQARESGILKNGLGEYANMLEAREAGSAAKDYEQRIGEAALFSEALVMRDELQRADAEIAAARAVEDDANTMKWDEQGNRAHTPLDVDVAEKAVASRGSVVTEDSNANHPYAELESFDEEAAAEDHNNKDGNWLKNPMPGEDQSDDGVAAQREFDAFMDLPEEDSDEGFQNRKQ